MERYCSHCFSTDPRPPLFYLSIIIIFFHYLSFLSFLYFSFYSILPFPYLILFSCPPSHLNFLFLSFSSSIPLVFIYYCVLLTFFLPLFSSYLFTEFYLMLFLVPPSSIFSIHISLFLLYFFLLFFFPSFSAYEEDNPNRLVIGLGIGNAGKYIEKWREKKRKGEKRWGGKGRK